MKRLSFTIQILILVLAVTGSFYCSKADNNHITAPGVVDGDIITLKSQVAGTLEELTLKEGEAVTRQTRVAAVNCDKVKNQLSELSIQLKEINIKSQKIASNLTFLGQNKRYLNNQVQRFRRLKEKNAVPGEKLEALEIKLLEAETSTFDLKKTLEELAIQKEKIENKREYLQLLINDHSIVSPVDGVVVETFVSLGENVFPGTAIADIMDRASLYVEIFVEEEEISTLKMNQEVQIQVDGMDEIKPTTSNGAKLKGVISFFGKKAEFSPKYIISEKERKSLLYQVKVRVEDPTGVLKIGMPVTVLLKKHA